MKKLLILSGIALCFSCGQTKETNPDSSEQFEVFGDEITADNALAAGELSANLDGKDTVKIKLRTKINEVCQKKGCWMNVDLGNNEEITVRFKDYGFFVPKDAAGREVIIEGIAFRDTTDVAELRHYAEDAGKSAGEIEKITEPEISIAFEASGVLIKK